MSEQLLVHSLQKAVFKGDVGITEFNFFNRQLTHQYLETTFAAFIFSLTFVKLA